MSILHVKYVTIKNKTLFSVNYIFFIALTYFSLLHKCIESTHRNSPLS